MSRYIFILCFLTAYLPLVAQQSTGEESPYFAIQTQHTPEGVVLESSGLAFLPDGRLAVATRRGEIWLLKNWDTENPDFTRFASGLHEPLGLAWYDGSFYTTQRTEVTRLTDRNKDGRADAYQTVASWPLTANYHEYCYGPEMLPDGDMLITLNVGWEGKGVSKSPWRGWMMQINPEGEMAPYAAGMRSPAGFGFNAAGDIFYAENQGDWVGSGRMTHLEKGDFAGHPASLNWADEPGSPLELSADQIHNDYGTMYRAAQEVPSLKLPAVWFPHSIMGISTSDIVSIPEGAFGPFSGQMLVGDQGQSKIMRVFLEKIDGEYQGACLPFREGFASGILRMEWAPDQSLMVGMTSRGWASTGPEPFGLQRMSWTGETPFELLKMEAQADGFLLTFTEEVDPQTALNPKSYEMQRFTYRYRAQYGSPVTDLGDCQITDVKLQEGNRAVRLTVKGLTPGYIHELRLPGLLSKDQQSVLHPLAYYTLNRIPGGMAHDHAAMTAALGTAGTKPEFNPIKHRTKLPAEWVGKVDQELKISTQPGLKYTKEELRVNSGDIVSLSLENPDDMQHNLVITQAGQGQAVGSDALQLGLKGPGMHYIPDNQAILWHTSLLEPETSETIYFQAPLKPGRYEYVCTVPGHAALMKGVLIVE